MKYASNFYFAWKNHGKLLLQSNITKRNYCLDKDFKAYLTRLNRRPRSIWYNPGGNDMLAGILVADGAHPKICFNKSTCSYTIFPLPLVSLIRPLENFCLIFFTPDSFSISPISLWCKIIIYCNIF